MADTVNTPKVVWETADHIKVHLTCISDGTGESAVVKIDKSTLVARDGAEPASLDILEARWAVQGFSSVSILWDHTTDETALVLAANGYEDFRGEFEEIAKTGGLSDGRGTGGTGDVLLTSTGAIAGASYDITLLCRKAAD